MKAHTLKTFIRDNLAFLLPYLLFLISGGIIILLFAKPDIHIYINEHSHGKADIFFRYITYLGDGITVAVFALVFLLLNIRQGLLIALSGTLSTLPVQILKHTFFSTLIRPKLFFEGVHSLFLIPGVENYSGNTFPSGHTAAAFGLCFTLTLLTKNKLIKFLLFILALTIGFSRVYLSQHFFNDIYAGSLIGIFSVVISYRILYDYKPLANVSWLDRRLIFKK